MVEFVWIWHRKKCELFLFFFFKKKAKLFHPTSVTKAWLPQENKSCNSFYGRLNPIYFPCRQLFWIECHLCETMLWVFSFRSWAGITLSDEMKGYVLWWFLLSANPGLGALMISCSIFQAALLIAKYPSALNFQKCMNKIQNKAHKIQIFPPSFWSITLTWLIILLAFKICWLNDTSWTFN